MGKFRSKLKGQTKGKRWAKGQSSSSNPETRKFRNEAKSRFFHVTSSANSNLTIDKLQKHDALQLLKAPEIENIQIDDVEEMEDEAQSVSSQTSSYNSSHQSFASEWSDCSNISFNKFMKTFHANSALHKEMLAILAAITEVIKQNGGTESSTEYYCSLLTTLDTVYNNEDQLTAVLALLHMGAKNVPEPVLRKTFNETCEKLIHVLKEYSAAENNVIIKSTLGVLTTLLRAQELALWNHEQTIQIFNVILTSFSLHTKPKWRKTAQHSVAAIVKSTCFQSSASIIINPAADKCAEFCERIFADNELITGKNSTILHTMGLLKETIQSFSKIYIKKSCESILRLMTLNYPLVTSCGLQVLYSLFSAKNSVISSDLNVKLITALYEYQPSIVDIQPILAWMLVMQEAHVHLADTDLTMSVNLLGKFLKNITQMWLSGRMEINNATTNCVEIILKDIVAPAIENGNFNQKLAKSFTILHSCLSYQYNNAWNQILHSIGVMFEVAVGSCAVYFEETLRSLAELRDSYKFSYNNELEYAIGAAVRSMGPEFVLKVIPLKTPDADLNIDRSWLLPVLKENIKFSTLNYFREGIFPLAKFCQEKSLQSARANNGIAAHSSELLYLQLWNLLPCFCNHPTDIKAEFKSIAKLLGMALSDHKELRLPVMASLRKLIESAKESDNNEDLLELSRFDKNYLPILFNLYTTKPIGSDEEGQSLAAFETIKLYLTIAREELTQQLFINALERLNASSDEPEDHFIKESILDLIRILIPYQNLENITKIFNQCVKNLPKIKNAKEQKKAYRILEEILQNNNNSTSLKEFLKTHKHEIRFILNESLLSAATSSKGARLRCYHYLLKFQPKLDGHSKLIKNSLPEAILCCKDINEKCRKTAYELLNTIGETLMGHNQMQNFIEMLCAGLVGTPQLISCTILALASALHNFSGALGRDNIKLLLENVSILCQSPTREIVASCVGFIKVYCTILPNLMIQVSLETVMKCITSMTEDCKRHFRIKVRNLLDRLVRKFGADLLLQFVPDTDQVMLKRLKNVKKINDRKKRLKKLDHQTAESEDAAETESLNEFVVKSKPKTVEEILADSDSDSEVDEEEKDKVSSKRPKKKTNTWIEENSENIVDFTDPNAISKISATKPAHHQASNLPQKNELNGKNRGFKSAPDGRIIIKDNDDDDGSNDDDDSEGQRKEKINFDSSEDESDNAATVLAETLLLANRKRKRNNNSSIKSGISGKSSTRPPISKYKAGGIGIHRNTTSSVKSGFSASLGSEYKSKKAAGDVKKKGKKLDPYAYVPLKRSNLNKRKKAKGAGQLKSIVKGAKKGTVNGAKTQKKNHFVN